MTSLRIELQVMGHGVVHEGTAPPASARLDELLPFFRGLDDKVIDVAVRNVERSGERVTCSKGCSACCRAQPVPVTPPEAYALARLVERMPEPRRTEVTAAFADCVERLRAAGLADTFLNRDPAVTREQARDVATRYHRLGLACPFLVDDACGIYEERPFVCRQYLVTSPVERCRDPLSEPVKPVPMPLRFATATLEIAERAIGTPQYTVPLVLALEYDRWHRPALERRFDGQQTFEQMIRALVPS